MIGYFRLFLVLISTYFFPENVFLVQQVFMSYVLTILVEFNVLNSYFLFHP